MIYEREQLDKDTLIRGEDLMQWVKRNNTDSAIGRGQQCKSYERIGWSNGKKRLWIQEVHRP